MAISNAYPKGIPVEDFDLFVGTKAYNNRTVNYTGQDIADYLNINAKIAIGGQLSFKFSVVPNIPKTIAFEGGLGDNTAFSAITKLIVSAIDLSSSNITIFLNYLNNSQILLSQQNQPNFFGHYKITGYTQIGTTDFYELDLEFIGGNGTIGDDQYYDIVSFVLTSGGPTTTPTLQEVMEVGRSYIETIGDFTYTLDFFSDTLFLNVADSTLNTIYGIQLSQEAQLYFHSQDDNKYSSVNTNLDGAFLQAYETDNLGTIIKSNILKVPFKTSGSGSAIFQVQNNLPAGTYELATLDDIPTTSGIPHATASGTDTYTATITGVAAYNDADAYLIRFTNGNTTSATLNINGLGAIPLYRNNDGALIGGDIVSNGEMLCVYNSTLNVFQTIGTAPNTLLSYVTNADSVTITKGQVVYAFGGQGDRMTVKLASNTSDATSARTVGVVLSASIAANQKGLIMMQGLLDGLNILPTSTFADGDPIYLGVTPGSITKVKPYAPNHLVYIATVTTASNGSAGRMYVNIQNGYELDELHNVQAQNPSLKDTLWYDNTVSPAQWKTASISTILGYTPLSSAIISLGGLTGTTQTFATGTTGTDFGISSAGTTHTFNLPTASATNRGALSSSDWSTFNGKQRDLFEFNAKEGVYLYENFLGAGLIASSLSGWSGESSGAGSSIVTVNNYPNRTNQQGVLRLATGTATTGLAQGRLGDNNAGSHFLGNGVYTLQFFVNIETLSDVTNRFYSIFGATTNANFANTSGMFFIYDEGVGTYGAASPNWKCITRNGGTITSTITSVAVTASQWYVLRIVVNAGGTSIEFFIDGVSVATHTTNLPTLITPRIANVKTTGTTNRNAFIDYALLQQVFTTPRPN
jgi:hypothetical protein